MLLFLTCVAPFISPELEFTRQQIIREFTFIANNPELPKPTDDLQPQEIESEDSEIIPEGEQPVVHKPEPIPEVEWNETPTPKDRPKDFDEQFKRENPILVRRTSPTPTFDDSRRKPTTTETNIDRPVDRQTARIQRKTYEAPLSDSERRDIHRLPADEASPFARESPTITPKVNIPKPPEEIDKREEVPTHEATPAINARLEVEWSVEITELSSTEAFEAFTKFPRIYRKLQLQTAKSKEKTISFNRGTIFLKQDIIIIQFQNDIMHELDFRVDNKGRYYISVLRGSTLKKSQIDFIKEMIKGINLLEDYI